MKAASRIQTAIEILDKIAESLIPMDNTIRDYMHHRRYIGSKDRAAIVERVYRIIRHYARLKWLIEQSGQLTTPRNFVIADLSWHGEDMTNLFTGDKHAPQPLTDEEKEWSGKLTDHASMPVSAEVECPEWAEEKLRGLFGDDFERQMRAMTEGASLDLRVNTVKGSRQKAKEMLAAQEVTTHETPYSPFGLRVEGKAFMSATKAFSKGLVEIQDEGSQLIALACDVKPGMRILDYCAGAGGKTLGLAAMMENKGNIVAMDIDTRRLEKGRSRFRKAGIHNVELRSLADDKNKKWLRRQKGAIDVVLVDAPCSSSGTWRRNPDLRWKQYGPSLDEIKEMQADILSRVADKVKPGGKLVYATCSLFREENEEQVEKFLADHSEYSVLNLAENWAYGDFSCEGPYLRLTPADHNTDGFFTAVLIRE
ncbi:MAG: RsmB/NOP family class I SAM-dependent RNA methyltransferase [Pseudomonadota bacterium]